jgi:biopolymer transport protein ExbB
LKIMMTCSSNVPGWWRRAAQSVRIVVAAAMIAPALAPAALAQEQTPPPADTTTAPATSPTSPAENAPPSSAAPDTSPAAQPSPPAQDAAPAASTDQAQPTPSSPTDAPADPAAAAQPTDAGAPPAQAAGEMPATGPGKSVDASHLPRDLSPWSMFMSADIVVKAVMIGLAFASVVTWTVWLAKSLELTWAKRRLAQSFAAIHASTSLAEAAQRLNGKKGIVSGLIELAALELHLSADVSDKAGIKERVASRLEGLAAAAGRDMNRGTGVLATIGSTSPFVGLFGTVWGIMNSFIGISEAQTTNLAIVAPGIAEALLATAIGLVAAIPAVIIYNHFSRQIGGYRAMIAEVSAEVLRLVSRDLDRGFRVVPKARAAE